MVLEDALSAHIAGHAKALGWRQLRPSEDSSLFNFFFLRVCPAILLRFFLADQRGIVCYPNNVRFDPSM